MRIYANEDVLFYFLLIPVSVIGFTEVPKILFHFIWSIGDAPCQLTGSQLHKTVAFFEQKVKSVLQDTVLREKSTYTEIHNENIASLKLL